MTKSFITNQPAINFTVVGFGQAGSRIADQFARIKDAQGNQTYNCLALNSNDGDLKDLQYIHSDNRYSLGLGGLGKNPEKAIKILNEEESVREKMKKFISEKIRPKDEVVIFVAGLGGGTGTSTIVKAISEFYEYHNKPLITQELKKLIEKEGIEKFKENQKDFTTRAFLNAKEHFKKIIVIATLPLRSDGADVLRQVNNFAQEIWKLAKDPTKGIAHVIFPDNQFFYDKFKQIPKNSISGIKNYRDYANREIVSIIHELNTGATEGGTSIVLDKEDLRRVWLEHNGSMFYSKLEVPANKIKTEEDLVSLFEKAFEENLLHGPAKLFDEKDGKKVAKKIYHAGLFAIVDNKHKYGKGAFIETAKERFNNNFITSEDSSVFSGFIENNNDGKISVYVFFKADALPERLEIGLVQEYEEFKKRQQEISFAETNIQQIEKENDSNFAISLEDLGIDNADLGDLLGESAEVEEKDTEKIDELLNNIDLSHLKNLAD